LRGGVLLYAAQGNPKIDAEIAEKRRFRTGTSLILHRPKQTFGEKRGLAPACAGETPTPQDILDSLWGGRLGCRARLARLTRGKSW